MNTKTVAAAVKAADPEAGTFEALVSVFGNVDLAGERVMPGAFAKSLERWRSAGAPIPVTWSHDWSLDGFIGSASPSDVLETDRGLVVRGRLDLADENGRKAHRLLRDGLVKNFSFSYEVLESRPAKDALELVELDLLEVGPTLVGANRSTELLAIKAAAATDDSAWDGGQAMGACSSAADYRQICAGERTVGAPDERQHWALPHHYLGKPANAAGVANARARFAQTKGLANEAAARTHLFETHTLPADEGKDAEALVADAAALGTKQGRVLSGANADRLKQVIDLIAQADELLDAVLAQLDPAADTDEGEGKGGASLEGGPEDQAVDPAAFTADLQEAFSLLP